MTQTMKTRFLMILMTSVCGLFVMCINSTAPDPAVDIVGKTFIDEDVGVALTLPQNYDEAPLDTGKHIIFSAAIAQYTDYQPRILAYRYAKGSETINDRVNTYKNIFANNAGVTVLSTEMITVGNKAAGRILIKKKSSTNLDVIVYYLFVQNNGYNLTLTFGDQEKNRSQLEAGYRLIEAHMTFVNSVDIGSTYEYTRGKLFFGFPTGYTSFSLTTPYTAFVTGSSAESYQNYQPAFYVDSYDTVGTLAQAHGWLKDLAIGSGDTILSESTTLTVAGVPGMSIVTTKKKNGIDVIEANCHFIKNGKEIEFVFVDELSHYNSTGKDLFALCISRVIDNEK